MYDALQMWDQAGERPYELLKEHNLLDILINSIFEESFSLEEPIYRGTRRHSQLEIGDILKYDYPTSWSIEKSIAEKFNDEELTPVIIELSSNNSIHALYNHLNSYQEFEVIVNPISLIVNDKYMENNTTILKVSPK